jgi:hypothetical protein
MSRSSVRMYQWLRFPTSSFPGVVEQHVSLPVAYIGLDSGRPHVGILQGRSNSSYEQVLLSNLGSQKLPFYRISMGTRTCRHIFLPISYNSYKCARPISRFRSQTIHFHDSPPSSARCLSIHSTNSPWTTSHVPSSLVFLTPIYGTSATEMKGPPVLAKYTHAVETRAIDCRLLRNDRCSISSYVKLNSTGSGQSHSNYNSSSPLINVASQRGKSRSRANGLGTSADEIIVLQ